MQERSILADVVSQVLSAPDRSYEDGDERVAEAMGPEQKPIRVVYTVRPDQSLGLIVRVITVYLIRKLKAL